MPRRIAILPDAVADQIAAGEVVERPASVVKELVENALDSGARHVRVELEQGGKILVLVSDDGSGMGREDAVLALDRHATSKVKSVADLVGVGTFGFRGEALPAIASVSRFTLTTSEGDGAATELSVTGGRLDRVADGARQRGTTVAVRGALLQHAGPAEVSPLGVERDSRRPRGRRHARAGPSRRRLRAARGRRLPPRRARRTRPWRSGSSAVWGAELAGTLVPVSYAAGAFRVTGFAQRPGDAQPTGRRTQLFVNGRPFKDPFLVRAAEAGYRSAIHPGDRPSLLLNIDVAPEDVDVNVHPAKLEVRFRDRIGVERVVEEAVRDSLGVLAAAVRVGDWRPAGDRAGQRRLRGRADRGRPRSLRACPIPPRPTQRRAVQPAAGFSVPLLQVFDTYIVYEAPEGVVIVDQHSAHERVLYELVMAQLTGADPPAQRLLLPLTLELTDEELDAVESHGEELRRVGFEAEPFGGRSVAVHAVPSPHPRFDAEACFRETVADLARGRFGGWANRLERFAATYACRAAVKAGQRLDQREMRELLLRLFATDLPPARRARPFHDRPVAARGAGAPLWATLGSR